MTHGGGDAGMSPATRKGITSATCHTPGTVCLPHTVRAAGLPGLPVWPTSDIPTPSSYSSTGLRLVGGGQSRRRVDEATHPPTAGVSLTHDSAREAFTKRMDR